MLFSCLDSSCVRSFIPDKTMPREIVYYLVQNSLKYILNGESDYYSFYGSTDNPKMAMRYSDYDGARQMARRLGWQWIVVRHSFSGDEPCFP